MPTVQNPRTFATPTVGTSPVQVIPKNDARIGLAVYNPGTVQLSICGDDVSAPVVNGTGTITLPPGQGLYLDAWTRALVAIAASGSSNPITVQEYS